MPTPRASQNRNSPACPRTNDWHVIAASSFTQVQASHCQPEKVDHEASHGCFDNCRFLASCTITRHKRRFGPCVRKTIVWNARGKSLIGRLANGWKKVTMSIIHVERRTCANNCDTILRTARYRLRCNKTIGLQGPWSAEFPVPWVDPLAKAAGISPTPIPLRASTARGRKKLDGPWGTVMCAASTINKFTT